MSLEQGQTVTVNYTAKLEDGTVFDTTEDKDPLEFQLGDNRVIPGFENAVMEMTPGDTTTAQIAPEDAFGPHVDDRVMQVPRSQLPADLEPQIGQQLEIPQENGAPIRVTITALDDESITLDANHPLAGQSLTFDIELLDVS